MQRKPLPNTTLMILLSLVFLPSVSFGQDAPVVPPPAIVFDGEKLAAAAKSLTRECNIDYETVPVLEALDNFSKAYKLKFDTKPVAAEIAKKPVSLAGTGVPMGVALLAILRKVDCTFSINPDCTVRIRKLPAPKAKKPMKPKPAKP